MDRADCGNPFPLWLQNIVPGMPSLGHPPRSRLCLRCALAVLHSSEPLSCCCKMEMAVAAAAAAKSLHLCPTLCDPVDCSLPSSSVHGIFQARTLEWVAIAFSWRRQYLSPNCSDHCRLPISVLPPSAPVNKTQFFFFKVYTAPPGDIKLQESCSLLWIWPNCPFPLPVIWPKVDCDPTLALSH